MVRNGESKASQKRIAATERQRQAVEYRKSGATYERIAERLGYAGPSSAYRAVMSALKKTLQEPADELRRLEIERLDGLLLALSGGIREGKPRAIEVALKVSERRATLLGLDAPSRVNVTLRELAERAAAEEGLDVASVLADAEAWLKGAR